MDTKNTWADAYVYLVAIWPVNRHGHQTTLLSWPYGKMLDQTQKKQQPNFKDFKACLFEWSGI